MYEIKKMPAKLLYLELAIAGFHTGFSA